MLDMKFEQIPTRFSNVKIGQNFLMISYGSHVRFRKIYGDGSNTSYYDIRTVMSGRYVGFLQLSNNDFCYVEKEENGRST